MVTMKEIARMAQVSQQAVSAALNGTGRSRVSERTRERILRIARETHYMPNAASRILRGCKSSLIGFFHQDPYFGVYPDIVREFSGQLRQAGYDLLSSSADLRTNEDEIQYAISAMECRRVDAVAVMCESPFPFPDFFHVPHVLIRTKDLFDISIDSGAGARMAVEHLFSHGRRRIAYLNSSPRPKHSRVLAWKDEMKQAGLYDPALNLSVSALDGAGERLVRELIRIRADGVVTHNDQIAAKLIVLLNDAGVRVPDDIAVIGYNGQFFCDFCRVPLATVLQPARQLACQAAKLLLERMESGTVNAPPAGILLKPELRPSASCGCAAPRPDPLDPVNTYNLLDSRDGFTAGGRKNGSPIMKRSSNGINISKQETI